MVLAAAGPVRRQLATQRPTSLSLPEGFQEPRVCLPGVLAIQGPKDSDSASAELLIQRLAAQADALAGFPLIVLVDDSDFTARTLSNFLWVTFTRSNPAADIHGVGAFVKQKHWGCDGAVVIDARIKPHHAPPLEADPEVSRRVDALAAPGGPLHGII